MEFDIREIAGEQEMEELIKLQEEVGGLPPKDTMSPITLSALLSQNPRVGLVLGAFHQGRMVGFSVGMGTMEPGLTLGHMLGVIPAYRNTGVGHALVLDFFDKAREIGCQRVANTYEPLEGRNAHLYLNKMNARGVRYKKAYYYIQEGIHQGMPQDRLLIVFHLDDIRDRSSELEPLSQALDRYPTATAEHMPQAEAVLLEIPADLRSLQKTDPQAVLDWRMGTRQVFEEYINQRGMCVRSLYSQEIDGARRSFYLLSQD